MNFESFLEHGDCLDLIRSVPNESVDLVVTDPPYGVSYRTNHRKDKQHRFTREILHDEDTEVIERVLPELYRVMKPNTALYMFCNSDSIDSIKPLVAQYFKVKNTIIWVKNNWTAGDLKAQFGKRYECIIYANKGRRLINGRRDDDVWYHDRVVGNGQLHQNQKPLDLIERIIEKSSDPGDVVFDPFMGSGTTAIACINKSRVYKGFEKDYEYYLVAKHRIEVAHGIDEKAVA